MVIHLTHTFHFFSAPAKKLGHFPKLLGCGAQSYFFEFGRNLPLFAGAFLEKTKKGELKRGRGELKSKKGSE